MGSFLFRANGLALGGELFVLDATGEVSRARRTAILSEGSFLLPNTGGQATSALQNFSYAGISIARASGAADGRRIGNYDRPTSYETSLQLSVQGLDIFGLLQVERLALRLTSSHPGPPARTADLGDADLAIRVEECSIEGLRVSGAPVTLDQERPALFRGPLATHAGIVAEARRSKRNVAGRAALDTLLFSGGKLAAGRVPEGLVIKSGPKAGGDRTHDEQGCMIVVPGLGTVYVGEVISTKESRRVNLLRVEVRRPLPGSAASASGTRSSKKKDGETEQGQILVGGAEINGSTYP